MIKSRTIQLSEPSEAVLAPQRGDLVEFEARKKITRGTVTSACTPAGGKLQLTISADGRRWTRLAVSVTVVRRAELAEPAPPPALGQQAGRPSPNSGKRYPAEPLTPEEATAIVGQCSTTSATGIRNRALITMLYRSGLRISEALAFRPADMNPRVRSIRLLDTKSGSPQTRGWHSRADDAVAHWTDKRRELGVSPRAPFFCTLRGEPLSADYVRGLLHRLGPRAGVTKRVHPHGWRHTFAAEMEAAGATVTTISKLLGHSSVAVTARYLGHLTNAQAVAALQDIDLPE